MKGLETITNTDLERKTISQLLSHSWLLRDRFKKFIVPEVFEDPTCREVVGKLNEIFAAEVTEEELELRLAEIAKESQLQGAEAEQEAPSFEVSMRILRDLARRRILLRFLDETQKGVLDRDKPLPIWPDSSLDQTAEDQSVTKNALRQQLRQAMFEVVEELEMHYKGRGKPVGISSGLAGVDAITSGFLPGKLYLIFAETGAGKTALALQIACEAMRDEDAAVAFSASKECMKDLLRPLWMQENIALTMNGRLNTADLEANAKMICSGALDLRTGPDRSLASIRDQAKRAGSANCKGILLVDDADTLASRERPFGAICQELRELARTEKIPVVIFAKLQRDPSSTSNAKVQALEQDCDVAMVLERDREYAKLSVVRNTGFPGGEFELWFDNNRLRFIERTQE